MRHQTKTPRTSADFSGKSGFFFLFQNRDIRGMKMKKMIMWFTYRTACRRFNYSREFSWSTHIIIAHQEPRYIAPLVKKAHLYLDLRAAFEVVRKSSFSWPKNVFYFLVTYENIRSVKNVTPVLHRTSTAPGCLSLIPGGEFFLQQSSSGARSWCGTRTTKGRTVSRCATPEKLAD